MLFRPAINKTKKKKDDDDDDEGDQSAIVLCDYQCLFLL